MPDFTTQQVTICRPARYLLRQPREITGRTLLVVALHGYGMRAETMLRLTPVLFQEEHVIASLEAPNSFFLAEQQADAEVGYNWGTRETADFHWKVHHDFLLEVLAKLQEDFRIGPGRTLLVGFSQPVGMNYRFVATHPSQVRGVIGICGGVPRNWASGPYGAVDAALLHISRMEDEYFPVETVSTFEAQLRLRATDVEFHLLPGKHRFPSNASTLVERWLNRVLNRDA